MSKDPITARGDLRLTRITKSYGDFTAVDDLTLTIPKGSFFALLGPSGCGKTTTLRMVAGLEEPTVGSIHLGDTDITTTRPYQRPINTVFQNYALFPHLTIFENIAFGLRRRGIKDVKEQVDKVLNLVELPHLAERKPTQLSGGQQQRIALARAIVNRPALLLLDEPLGALDKNLREQMQYEIKHLHESLGLTVVYVTHDQTEALTMSNRIAVFDDGVVLQCSSPEDLYEKPENAFVANFIGENNRLMGTVESIDGDKATVKTDSGDIVIASKVNVNKAGDRATLSLRPERIMVSPSKGKTPNTYSAKVEELIYHGDHIRTRFSVCGHDDFIVKIPNSIDNVTLKEGKQVDIGWMSEDCLALDG